MKAALGLGSFLLLINWSELNQDLRMHQNTPTPPHPLHPALKLRSFHSQADARPADPHYVKTNTLRLVPSAQ